jgi:hypothetical protein
MTRAQKIALIGLATLAVLFIAALTVGQLQPSCPGRPPTCAASYQPGAAMQKVGRWLAWGAPTALLPQPRYVVPAQGQVQIHIAPATDKMRTLKLHLTQGGPMQLSLLDQGPVNPDLADQAKGSTLPRAAQNPADPRSQSFVVSAAGAQLILQCQGSSPCTVETR